MAVLPAANSRVFVHISRAIPSGLIGQVDGVRALIRRRELSWEQPQPDDDYLDRTFEAIVLRFNAQYGELELSLRLAQRDPWSEAPGKYPAGAVVCGRVTGLIRDAAFVEIEPGVEGFLHVNELGLPAAESGQMGVQIDDWLWIGDSVKVVVGDVEPAHRRLRLSLKSLLGQRAARQRSDLWSQDQAASAQTVASVINKDIRQQLLRLDTAAPSPEPARRLQALVVEDDEQSGPALVRLLTRNHCDVALVEDAVRALADIYTRSTPYDIILIDRGLPGLAGDELVRQLQAEHTPSRLVMVLEQEQLADQPDAWRRIEECGVDVFLKGDEGECQAGIVAVLAELRTEQATRHFPNLASRRTPIPPPADDVRADSDVQDIEIGPLLTHLKHDTEATTATVLCYDSATLRLTTLASAGKGFAIETASPDIMYSPLSDVLLKDQRLAERDALHTPRFARLIELMPFVGFIGIPISGSSAMRYALILLREEKAFSARSFELARSAAYALAADLAGKHMMQVLQPWQAQNLAGQLTAGAVHEINNKLLATKLQIEDLQLMVADLWRNPEKASDPTFLHSMEDSLERIAAARQEASILRQQYLSLTAGDDPQPLNMNDIVTGIARLLRPEARSSEIALVTVLAEGLPSVYCRPSQVRQILLNVLLNAIQQMRQIGRKGRIVVETRHAPGSERPVQVWMSDEGPGIHAQAQQRIFDFGFTTRKGGAGLGLTISRQAARSLGGDLRLVESYVLWGSTFVLDMPQGG
jgi:signal transduction histidine kinase/predicted RNA-binding protein with RPS1 domain